MFLWWANINFQILDECECAPGFHNEGGSDAMEVSFSDNVTSFLIRIAITIIW